MKNCSTTLSLALTIFTISAVSCKNGNAVENQPAESATTEVAATRNTAYDLDLTILCDKINADGVRELSVKPSGVCSSQIDIAVKDGVIVSAKITGGCPGNSMGISKLVEGMTVTDAIEKIEGIDCQGRGTSCPDQLAKALKCLK